jgi:hypothetical protein
MMATSAGKQERKCRLLTPYSAPRAWPIMRQTISGSASSTAPVGNAFCGTAWCQQDAGPRSVSTAEDRGPRRHSTQRGTFVFNLLPSELEQLISALAMLETSALQSRMRRNAFGLGHTFHGDNRFWPAAMTASTFASGRCAIALRTVPGSTRGQSSSTEPWPSLSAEATCARRRPCSASTSAQPRRTTISCCESTPNCSRIGGANRR